MEVKTEEYAFIQYMTYADLLHEVDLLLRGICSRLSTEDESNHLTEVHAIPRPDKRLRVGEWFG